MNTNRSQKLGTVKALRRFGSRRGMAAYNSTQWARQQKELLASMVVPNERMAEAFKRMTKAAKGAVLDFHQFAKFMHYGPLENSLTIVKPCGDNPWFTKATGNPGVSVHDITTMAQQYAYLHPNK